MKSIISLVLMVVAIVNQSKNGFSFEQKNEINEVYSNSIIYNLEQHKETLCYRSFQESVLKKKQSKKQHTTIGKDPWSIKALEKAGVYNDAPYNLLTPEFTYTLPDILKEVSGIELDDNGNMYCVQDELGVVFGYDLEKSLITEQYRFSSAGDFEDLTIQADSIFVLRSDGTVFGFRFPQKAAVRQFKVSLDATDYESLTHDEETGLFYIVSKDKGLVTGKTKRVIYSFKSSQLSKPKAELTIDIPALNNMLKQRYPKLIAKKFKFNPSAIAIHPKTKDFYLLSANDRVLLICNSAGVKGLYPLPSALYHKPEGLAFTRDGALYISSEGEKGGLLSGLIYKFSQR